MIRTLKKKVNHAKRSLLSLHPMASASECTLQCHVSVSSCLKAIGSFDEELNHCSGNIELSRYVTRKESLQPMHTETERKKA